MERKKIIERGDLDRMLGWISKRAGITPCSVHPDEKPDFVLKKLEDVLKVIE